MVHEINTPTRSVTEILNIMAATELLCERCSYECEADAACLLVDISKHLKHLERMTISDWILTDDASMQHIKRLSVTKYRCIELRAMSTKDNKFGVYVAEIDKGDYLNNDGAPSKELKAIITAFGYRDIDDILKQYEESADQVMLECIFEHLGPFDCSLIFVGDEGECVEFIKQYVEKKGC